MIMSYPTLPGMRETLGSKGFNKAKLMMWPLMSSVVNPIENLWPIVKRKSYEASKQYHSKNELKEATKPLSPVTNKNLTSSMDEILVPYQCNS